MDQMAKLSVTWSEARTGRSILGRLCKEYLPNLSPSTDPAHPTSIALPQLDTDQALEYPSDPNDLVEWLSGQNLWTMPFPMPEDNTFNF